MTNEEQYQKELIERHDALALELREMEKQFNIKKEEYLKIQGALEMLAVLTAKPETTEQE